MNTFKAHSKPIYSLAFSPDGRHLLSSGGDRKVILWSLDTFTAEQEWPGSQLIGPVAFSPDGSTIGTGGNAIRVWRIGTEEAPLVDSKEYAESCCFSPDGAVFAAFGVERAIMRWAIPSGAPLPGGWGGTRASNNNTRFPVGGMAFRPDGAVIANCYGVLGKRGFDSVIHLWDAASGTLLDTLEMEIAYDHPSHLAFSPDGALLAAETGPILHIWDVTAKKEVVTRKVSKKHFKDFAFMPDGQALLAVHNENELRIWNTATWTEISPITPQIGKLTALALSDNKTIAVGSAAGKIKILLP